MIGPFHPETTLEAFTIMDELVAEANRIASAFGTPELVTIYTPDDARMTIKEIISQQRAVIAHMQAIVDDQRAQIAQLKGKKS